MSVLFHNIQKAFEWIEQNTGKYQTWIHLHNYTTKKKILIPIIIIPTYLFSEIVEISKLAKLDCML